MLCEYVINYLLCDLRNAHTIWTWCLNCKILKLFLNRSVHRLFWIFALIILPCLLDMRHDHCTNGSNRHWPQPQRHQWILQSEKYSINENINFSKRAYANVFQLPNTNLFAISVTFDEYKTRDNLLFYSTTIDQKRKSLKHWYFCLEFCFPFYSVVGFSYRVTMASSELYQLRYYHRKNPYWTDNELICCSSFYMVDF